MSRFDDLAANLQRQRKDLERRMDDTAVSQAETGSILEKIEELRRRAQDSDARFRDAKPPDRRQ